MLANEADVEGDSGRAGPSGPIGARAPAFSERAAACGLRETVTGIGERAHASRATLGVDFDAERDLCAVYAIDVGVSWKRTIPSETAEHAGAAGKVRSARGAV